MYLPLSDDKHQMVRDSSKNALASADVIVTQLLRYNMPLLYFVCNHLITKGILQLIMDCELLKYIKKNAFLGSAFTEKIYSGPVVYDHPLVPVIVVVNDRRS